MGKMITGILNYAISKGASDAHITEGEAVTFRIQGELTTLDSAGIINSSKIDNIVNELFNGDENLIKNFNNNHDSDFAYMNEDGTSFRVNGFFKMGKKAFVLRRIEKEPIPIEKLGLPKGVALFTKLKQGLVLITGPTGSGKSTSMVALLNQINKTRGEHVITIEDPIEFVFTNNKSIFSQREVGRDTNTFPTALRAAMREDPDVVVIGEMRDKETVQAALELAETGHLVFSTLHTSSAVQTVQRLLSFFPLDSQNAIRDKLADSLEGVLSQRLIPRKDGSGRIGIYELMIINTGIKNQIRTGTLNQIQSSIETGSKDGMIGMKDFADNLYEKDLVNKEDYMDYFVEDNM